MAISIVRFSRPLRQDQHARGDERSARFDQAHGLNGNIERNRRRNKALGAILDGGYGLIAILGIRKDDASHVSRSLEQLKVVCGLLIGPLVFGGADQNDARCLMFVDRAKPCRRAVERQYAPAFRRIMQASDEAPTTQTV